MANKIANRKAICDTLLEAAATDKDIVVLCSDSRGSASLTPFFDQYPQQSIEVGIAEQDLVSIAAGMASCGKKAWAASPASFVTTRSYEQCKVDVSYSNTNVSSSASRAVLWRLGHEPSLRAGYRRHERDSQHARICRAIPDRRARACPGRRQQAGLHPRGPQPGGGRVHRGRVPVPDGSRHLGVRRGADVTIVATGEEVRHAVDAADLLAEQGISATVLDMYCVKPLDAEAVIDVPPVPRAPS